MDASNISLIARRAILPRRIPIKGARLKNALLFFCLAICALSLSAAVPIQGKNLNGVNALNARRSLISAAAAYLGTPYRYGGFDRRGMDCSGLVYTSFRDSLNAGVPRTAASLYSWVEKIPSSELRPGDLVFFVTGGTSAVTHVGIFTGNGRFIHSASEGPATGVIYSRLDEAYWRRTYTGSGRVLPWDSGAETALAGSSPARGSAGADRAAAVKEDGLAVNGASASGASKSETSAAASGWTSSTGFFAGGGAAWTIGGFFPGAPSVFRGLAGQVKVGYKGLFNDAFQIALEARPEWDRDLEIVRLPLTLSLGNDNFQVFAGPALTIGKAALETGEAYHPSFLALGELGFSAALPPIKLRGGALSVFAEAAWQPYSPDRGYGGDFVSDLAANSRLSLGLRYLHLLEK